MATKSLLKSQLRRLRSLNSSCNALAGSKKTVRLSRTASSLSRNTETQEKYIYKSPWQDITIPDLSVIEYLKQRSAGYDDRVAMVCGEDDISLRYGELWEQVTRLSSALARRGVGAGCCVALVSHNCPEMVAAFLACTAVGAVVTTANPNYTPAEIEMQLEDSRANLVIYHPAVGETVQRAVGGKQMKLMMSTHAAKQDGAHTSLPELLTDDGSCAPVLQLDPRSDVVVMPYSSGTTGRPKGVMLTHANLVANLQQITNPDMLHYDPHEVQTMFGILPMFHIYGMVGSLYMSLATGSRCITFTHFDPKSFVAALETYRPTLLHTVPPILNFLGLSPAVTAKHFESVSQVICGAAPVGEAVINMVRKKLPGDWLFQEGYGMTELSPVSHMSPNEGAVLGSCGRPVANTEVKIIDMETGEALGPGQDGELCVRGPQVMKGYYNNRAATDATIDRCGWLHTGDVARVDRAGNFFIVDRLKELIKVKGFQVAPAELEDLLRTLPGVVDVAVVGVPCAKAGELPRAYVVQAGHLTEAEVSAFVAAKLSEHKQLAGGVVFCDAIPKSATGKILRRVLRDQARQ